MRRTLTILLFAIGLGVSGLSSAVDLSRADRVDAGVEQSRQTSSVEERRFDSTTNECNPDCARERQAEKNTLHY